MFRLNLSTSRIDRLVWKQLLPRFIIPNPLRKNLQDPYGKDHKWRIYSIFTHTKHSHLVFLVEYPMKSLWNRWFHQHVLLFSDTPNIHYIFYICIHAIVQSWIRYPDWRMGISSIHFHRDWEIPIMRNPSWCLDGHKPFTMFWQWHIYIYSFFFYIAWYIIIYIHIYIW